MTKGKTSFVQKLCKLLANKKEIYEEKEEYIKYSGGGTKHNKIKKVNPNNSKNILSVSITETIDGKKNYVIDFEKKPPNS
jgi:hypothetical protein